MLFTSPVFFALVALTFSLYYATLFRNRQVGLLIAASCVFYAYDQPYLLLLLVFSASIATGTSHRILVSEPTATKRAWAIAGVAANLLILGFFKYNHLLYTTLIGAPGDADGLVRDILALPLPIGISFYTFHGISLVVDVYRRGNVSGTGKAATDRDIRHHIGRTFLYLTFFPQLIAGPIVKAHDFYPQIRPKRFCDIDWDGAIRALVVGYFLKCVIADNLADQTFWLAKPYFMAYSTLNILFFLFGYSIQIFADFAGYSLIAIGLARLFGYVLPDNFRFPYISQSFSEFWTRWHMSLSAWLREYLYFPLGGNRKGAGRTYLNLMLVMTLGGLWHGGAWSYAAWGLWHGTALCVERLFRGSWFYRTEAALVKATRMTLVFAVVTIGWLFFKLPMSDVPLFLETLVRNRHLAFAPGLPVIILLYALPVAAYHGLFLLKSRYAAAAGRLQAAQKILLGVMFASIMLMAGEPNAFIYFQF